MKFGVFSLSDNDYHVQGITRSNAEWYEQFLEQAVLAEELGYHSVSVGEHHFSQYGVVSSPQVLLGAVAGKTARVRLSPAVTVLPYSDPLRVAEDYAVLDQVSLGRVDFAVGRGFLPVEFNGFGISMQENRDRFRENLKIILKAWEGQPFSYEGRWRRVHEVRIVPETYQREIPLFISVFSPPTMEWAAEKGYHVILAPFAAAANFGDMEHALKHYYSIAAKHGHKGLQARCSYFIYVFDENEAIPGQQEEAVEAIVRYFRTTAKDFPTERDVPEHMRYWLKLYDRLSSITPEMLNTNSVIFGTPEFCVEQFKKLEMAGIGQVIGYFSFGGLSHQRVVHNMKLFAEKVMPHFT